MDIAQAMNFKELHLSLLRILAQNDRGLTPKEIITRFSLTHRAAYYPNYKTGIENKITDAKIYGAIKFLEKEKTIFKKLANSNYSDRTSPCYLISEAGKDLIKHSMTLSLQNLLSSIVMNFFRHQVERFAQYDIRTDSSIGIIGSSFPFGYSILAFLSEWLANLDPLSPKNPLYFIDIDQILQNLYNKERESETLKFEEQLSPLTKNTIYRKCHYDKDNQFRMDIGNHQLDIIITVMLFTIFPNDSESILKEIYRILKPGGIVIFQEQTFLNAFFPWLLEIIPPEEQRLISDLFVHIIEQAHKNRLLNLPSLVKMIEKTFGEIISIDELGEIKMIYAQKPELEN